MTFFKTKWTETMKNSLKLSVPQMSDKEIDKFLNKEYEDNLKDHQCVIYNSYTRKERETSLLGVLDWIQERKPIVTEAGTFFKRTDEGRCLHGQIVHSNLMTRSELKKKMFSFEKKGDMVMAKFHDHLQLLEKLRANAPYGVDSNPYSFSYSFSVASSTTFSARGQTSMAALNFENIMNDFVKFESMDEMYTYVGNIILKDSKSWMFKTDDIIDIVPSKKDLVRRLINKFDNEAQYDISLIESLVEGMSKEIRTRVYYKSNIKAFVHNGVIKSLIQKLMSAKDIELINPYEPEDEAKEALNSIMLIINEFVGYKYQYFRYEDKIRFKKRSTAIVIDTDSCILHIGGLIDYMLCNTLKLKLFKTTEGYTSYVTKLINIIGISLDFCMNETIAYYTSKLNIDNSMLGVKLKNEFQFGILGLTKSMKCYYASILRKEGNVYKVPKTELKGLTVMKSTSTDKASRFLIDKIIKDRILYPKNGRIELGKIMDKTEDFIDSMREEILSGDMSYHKQGIKVRKASGYKDAMGIQVFKATYVWNALMPDEEIELPNVVTVIKVDLQKKKDLAKLDRYPKIFERALKLFEENETIAKNGITSIAVPRDYDDMPDWVLDIISVEDIINDNISLCSQVFGGLGICELTVNSSSGNNKYYDRLVRI